jgi:hypothetical protein
MMCALGDDLHVFQPMINILQHKFGQVATLALEHSIEDVCDVFFGGELTDSWSQNTSEVSIDMQTASAASDFAVVPGMSLVVAAGLMSEVTQQRSTP